MSPRSQLRGAYGKRPETFSAWTAAIVFATVAMISFAIDQAIIQSPSAGEQNEYSLPSLLHPVMLIETLIDAVSD